MILILILLISLYIDDDVSRRSSYGVYISQRIYMYALQEHIRILVTLNSRKTFLTAKLLIKATKIINPVFSKFYSRIDQKISCQSEETSKQGISNSEFCGGLVYKLKKIVENPNYDALT